MMKLAPEIRKIAYSLAVLAALLLPALSAAPAHAGTNSHSWVSHNGDDNNSCQMAFPCATFAQALTQTQDGGKVSCLDSGLFGLFAVTISVTIDCTGTVAAPIDNPINFLDGPTILINAPGKVVILRGLNVTGSSLGSISSYGVLIVAATAVYIEDCAIDNYSLNGIWDERTTGLTKLVIKNTMVRHNGSAGIVVAAAPKNSVVLENVQSIGNTFGIAVGTGNNVVISRSVMSENSVAGVAADAGAQVYVENTKISHNAGYGIFASGKLVLANSDIVFNTTSIAGTTTSFGNNRLFGNGSGTAPTPAGGVSTDFGQQ